MSSSVASLFFLVRIPQRTFGKFGGLPNCGKTLDFKLLPLEHITKSPITFGDFVFYG